MARLRNFVRKNFLRGFRAVLFRMVPKHVTVIIGHQLGFRAVLFRMVPKQVSDKKITAECFRAVLFRMVPKRLAWT